MSHGEEPLARQEDVSSRPAFELNRRGYDKQQVDQYIAQVDRRLSMMAADRSRAGDQAKALNAQLQAMQSELAELRDRPAQVERASFRHLGPMVDQMLALAEKQAEAIHTTATQRGADHQAQAEKALAEAREQAEKLRAESEAAHQAAAQEADRINEESAQQLEAARAEAEAVAEAARVQLQQDAEAAGAQLQQELTQWKANVEKEIGERWAVAERELARQHTIAEQKAAALHAEAQQYSADLRRRAGEQAGAHQQQLAIVQQEIQTRQATLTQIQTELEAAQQLLAQSLQKGAATDNEVAKLQHRLGEIRQDLAAETTRLEETRRAADSAERHAKDVRARVQREAKRVAEMASAAVMAAAASGGETGEYRIVPVRTDSPLAAAADRQQAEAARSEHRGAASEQSEARDQTEAQEPADVPEQAEATGERQIVEDPTAQLTPERDNPIVGNGNGNGRVRLEVERAIPAQRGMQQSVAADAE